MTTELWQLDATDLAAQIRAGKACAREAVESHLARLDAVNPRLNAVVHRFAEQALAEADAADRRQRGGAPLGPLHGVPVTIKITADQKGQPTDNGVRAFKDVVAAADAPVVRNLREAGAIVIGRTNSPAFAMRFMTENQLHGPTLNPWDRDLTCGGSSGGAGAAVAAGIGALAHGTDIAGSIRWPAYCNGIVGLRTTPGRVPSHNATSTMDYPNAAQLMAVAGPMTRSVRDARLGLASMAARGDPADPLWLPVPLNGDRLSGPLRVALVTEAPGVPVHPSSVEAVRRAGRHLAAAGYRVEEATPPGFVRAFELWDVIGLAEIRLVLEPLLDLIADPGLTFSQKEWWSCAAPVDLQAYQAGLRERHTLMRKWSLFMEDYPLVVTPTCAVPSVRAGRDAEAGGMRELLDQVGRYLFQSPVLGLPALAVPVGRHEGRPLGVQICSRRFREDLCLDAGEVIEACEGACAPIDPRW